MSNFLAKSKVSSGPLMAQPSVVQERFLKLISFLRNESRNRFCFFFFFCHIICRIICYPYFFKSMLIVISHYEKVHILSSLYLMEYNYIYLYIYIHFTNLIRHPWDSWNAIAACVYQVNSIEIRFSHFQELWNYITFQLIKKISNPLKKGFILYFYLWLNVKIINILSLFVVLGRVLETRLPPYNFLVLLFCRWWAEKRRIPVL